MAKKKLTIDEIFKEQLKMTDGDERKAAELALSLGAYGLFDDADDESKNKAIDEFLEEYGSETESVPDEDKNPKVEPVGDGEEVVKNVEDKLNEIDKERGDLKITKENKKRKYENTGDKISPEGIKTIDVNAKEWRDKVNGNSYFSGVVIINYGMSDERILKMPHQYGYGEMYLQVAGEFFDKDAMTPLWRWCQNNGIILRYHKTEVRRKKDLMENRKINESVVDDILNEMEEDQFIQKYIDQVKFLADSGDPDYKITSRFADIIMNDFGVGYDDAYTIAERFINKDVDYLSDTDFDENNKYKDFRDNFMIFDNGGRSYDRYTIVDKNTGDVYSADENPSHPQGFGQYSHTEDDPDKYIQIALNDGRLGNAISYNDLPEGTKAFIRNLNECRKTNKKYKKEDFIDIQVPLTSNDIKDKPKEKVPSSLDNSIDYKSVAIKLNDEINKMSIKLQNIIEDLPVGEIKLTDKSKNKLDKIAEYCKILLELK